MTNISTYRINMHLTGRLTLLPDSQKIFGVLTYMYSTYYSAEDATKFVQAVKCKGIYFTLSNMMPTGYLPVPQTFLLNKLSQSNIEDTKKDTKKEKGVYKNIKKRQYAKKEQIYEMMNSPSKADKCYPYVCVKSSQQIHASIKNVQHDISGLDPAQYSVPEITVIKVEQGQKEVEESSLVALFSFYISMSSCDEGKRLLSMLEKEQEKRSNFFLGPRTSQGLNTYTIKDITQEDFSYSQNTNEYLNMGMLLPEKIDFKKSTLKIFTSERRPYDAVGGWEKKDLWEFISFIEAGSIIHLEEGKGLKHVGCAIQSPFNVQAIVFGEACLFPLNERKT